MRIIGGEARGRTLHFTSGSKERPTSDFLRETLFNLLGPVQEKSFLDLYAGSGSVGIEAASRGAREVVLVEKDKKISAVAQKNIVTCGFDKKCRILTLDIGGGLGKLYKNKYEFDIIFADPPYSRGLVEQTIKLIMENPVLARKAVVVIQHSAREDFTSILRNKNMLRNRRKYGDSALTFLNMECP
jgi:16S rRNA (guanine(966)-N(2))-methyltransferase RsmD